MEKCLSIKEQKYINHMQDIPWALDLSDDELLESSACASIRMNYFSGFQDCQIEAIRILSKNNVNINIIKQIFDLDESTPCY